MERHFRTQWAAALRSGVYPQTRTVLRDEVGFSVLGVALDLIGPERWSQDSQYNVRDWDEARQYWPDDVAVAYGLPLADQQALLALNDGGSSFAALADYIEAHE